MRTNRSSNASAGQVSTTAAQVYEKFFVPALFAQWVEPMLDAVHAHEGDHLLESATGTGVRRAVRRYSAWARQGPSSR